MPPAILRVHRHHENSILHLPGLVNGDRFDLLPTFESLQFAHLFRIKNGVGQCGVEGQVLGRKLLSCLLALFRSSITAQNRGQDILASGPTNAAPASNASFSAVGCSRIAPFLSTSAKHRSFPYATSNVAKTACTMVFSGRNR